MRVSARVRANRENAKRSTGPKTKEGKERAARNAFKHGLSIPASELDECSQDIQAFAQQLIDHSSSEEKKSVALACAQAQVEINRVRRVRQALYSDPKAREKKLTRRVVDRLLRLKLRMVNKTWAIDEKTGDLLINESLLAAYLPEMLKIKIDPEPQSLEQGMRQLAPKLAKLDRYERRAFSQRRKAIARLGALCKDEKETEAD